MPQESPQKGPSQIQTERSRFDQSWKQTCFDILPNADKETILTLQARIKQAPIFLEGCYVKLKQLTRTRMHNGPSPRKVHRYDHVTLNPEAFDYLTLRLAYEIRLMSSPRQQADLQAKIRERIDLLLKGVDDIPELFMFGPEGFRGLPSKGNSKIYKKIKQAREALTFLRKAALERLDQVPKKSVPVTFFYRCFRVYLGKNLPNSRMMEFLKFINPILRELAFDVTYVEKATLQKSRTKKNIPKRYLKD